MPTVQIERRRRGVFGWLFALLFWGWHLLMVAWIIGAGGTANDLHRSAHSAAEHTGVTIGTGLSVAFILLIWGLGTVIFGAMMLFTRGRREFITEERP